MIIAIDGPAAAGKGTLAKRLAERFGLAQLETGLLYRACGLKLLRANHDPRDVKQAATAARALKPEDLNDKGLRSDEAAIAASAVATIPEVRAALLDFQRAFAKNPPNGAKGAVLDGRDIGSTVCPDAGVKLFIIASVEVRAKRRYKELLERGLKAIYSRVLSDMKERDAQDAGRAVSPLVPANDAFVLDTSDLDADAAFAAALDYIEEKTSLRTGPL